MTFNITPSGRIDYCSQCKQEHGYDCPLDTQPNQPDSVEELDETDLTEFERKLAQAILSALEHRGFYDCGKYLDTTFIEFLRPIITQAKAKERERILNLIDQGDHGNEENLIRLKIKKALQDNQPLP